MDFLPTPTTRDYKDGSAEHERNGIVQTDTLARAIFNGQEVAGGLMPTPKAQDGVKGNLKTSAEREEAGFFVDLPNVANDLALENLGGVLSQPQQPQIGREQTTAEVAAPQVTASQPSSQGGALLPTTRRSMGNASAPEVEAGDPKKRIENTVLLGEISWGKFEPAIRRWEQVLGRPAPAPTKPDGKDGAHRLSSAFTEWMMGLPEGWITGHGLSRNDELKMAGNGVVPQQAELALRILLDGVALPAGGGASESSNANGDGSTRWQNLPNRSNQKLGSWAESRAEPQQRGGSYWRGLASGRHVHNDRARPKKEWLTSVVKRMLLARMFGLLRLGYLSAWASSTQTLAHR